MTESYAILAIFAASMAAAAFVDARRFRVPNALVAAIAAAGFGHALAAPGVSAPAAAVAGGAALLFGFALFSFGVFGAGDAKLAAAAAVWLGPAALPAFAVLTMLFGGLVAAFALAARRAPGLAAPLGPVWRARLADGRRPVPYALAVAPGAVAAMTATQAGWV
ncbi:MAG: prepilin peptidase [Pseudomonadota bacterium]